MSAVLKKNKKTNKAEHPPWVRMRSHLQVLSVKGQRAADQRVQNHPQAPDIHFWPVVLLPLEKFRRGVRRRAAESVQLAAHGELIAEAKVGDLYVHVCV